MKGTNNYEKVAAILGLGLGEEFKIRSNRISREIRGVRFSEYGLQIRMGENWTAINPQIERELIRGDWKVFKSRKGKE